MYGLGIERRGQREDRGHAARDQLEFARGVRTCLAVGQMAAHPVGLLVARDPGDVGIQVAAQSTAALSLVVLGDEGALVRAAPPCCTSPPTTRSARRTLHGPRPAPPDRPTPSAGRRTARPPTPANVERRDRPQAVPQPSRWDRASAPVADPRRRLRRRRARRGRALDAARLRWDCGPRSLGGGRRCATETAAPLRWRCARRWRRLARAYVRESPVERGLAEAVLEVLTTEPMAMRAQRHIALGRRYARHRLGRIPCGGRRSRAIAAAMAKEAGGGESHAVSCSDRDSGARTAKASVPSGVCSRRNTGPPPPQAGRA
jgi:hypothetical protein